MLTVERPIDLAEYAGQVMGASDWVTITQDQIDAFARLSGDDHWIHIDVEQAREKMPGGKTIAHGILILSLIPALQRQIFGIRKRGRGLNYGYGKVRFVSPVPVDSRIRLKQTLTAALLHKAGAKLEILSEIQMENSERPAIVAESIVLIEDE